MAVFGSLAQSTRLRAVLALLVVAGSLLAWSSRADASASLTVTPITFNIVGLDSNDVNAGPNAFPVGARVCNVGDGAATGLSAAFDWSTSNAFLALNGAATQALDDIAAQTCADVYFEVAITRNAAAYDTTRGYTISVTGDGGLSASSPTPRELYVEHLVSQNRNAIASITGPTTVYVGDTATFVLDGSTATQGYEQLESFLTMSPSVFRVRSVAVTYTSPTGGANDKPWADACGFDFVPSSPTYRSCIGPAQYAGAKAGGTIQVTYTADVIGTGVAMLDATIYDFSGSSYHYNGDYGDVALSVTALPALPPTTTTTSTTVATTTTTELEPTTTTSTSTTVAPTTTTTSTTSTTVVPTTTTTTLVPTATTTTTWVPTTTTTSLVNSALTFLINTGGVPGPVKQSGDVVATTFTVVSGSVPPGLTLLSDGTFAGTATQVGTFEFDASVCQAGVCTVRHVRVEVLSARVAAQVQSTPLASTGNDLAALTALGLLLCVTGALVRRATANA